MKPIKCEPTLITMSHLGWWVFICRFLGLSPLSGRRRWAHTGLGSWQPRHSGQEKSAGLGRGYISISESWEAWHTRCPLTSHIWHHPTHPAPLSLTTTSSSLPQCPCTITFCRGLAILSLSLQLIWAGKTSLPFLLFSVCLSLSFLILA